MAAVQFESGINILPDNLLLDIFGYLTVKDLCLIGRVCRRWRRITLDNKFWRHVDLRPYKLDLGRMWKVIRRHFSHVLRSLRLRGYLDKGGTKWNKANISDAMLKDLKERCPNLRELEICYCNLASVSASNLPASVQVLIVTDSLIPQGWFEPLLENPLPNLQHLDLSNSSKTCNSDLKHLSKHAKLQVLKLNACYRISQDGLHTVALSFQEIHTLEIASCTVTDLACHHLGRHLKNLHRLKLSECKGMTSAGLACLATGLKKLECLEADSALYSQDLTEHLHSIKSLKVLHIENNHIDQETKNKLVKALPNCDIYF